MARPKLRLLPTGPKAEAAGKNLAAFIKAQPRLYRGKHTKACPCYPCVERRLKDMEQRVKLAVKGGARPADDEHTIPVRAHFRRNPRHLVNDPALRDLVRQLVREVVAELKK